MVTSRRTSACRAGPRAEHGTDAELHVYRLDFTLIGGEQGEPTSEQLTMNLREREHGNIAVGRNVPIDGAGGANASRHDVGLKLGADCGESGQDVFLHVSLEVSDADGTGGAIHKANGFGDVLIKPGQPALALRMDDGHKQYDLSVAATQLR